MNLNCHLRQCSIIEKLHLHIPNWWKATSCTPTTSKESHITRFQHSKSSKTKFEVYGGKIALDLLEKTSTAT